MTDWRGWKITDEQAEQIRRGDINAINIFYFDNLDRIRAMAYNYSYNRNYNCKGLAEDLIQNVYIDLTVFKQANGLPVVDGVSLSSFVFNSFRFAPYGGLCYLFENNPKILCGGAYKDYCPDILSLDKPFGKGDSRHQDDDNGRTLGEVVSAPDILDYEDYTDILKNVVSDILSPRENEYFGYFIECYGNTRISELMGYKSDSNNSARVIDKLRRNYKKILERLAFIGVNVDYYKNKLPYDPKKGRTYKLSIEQRRRAAESQRRRRAAKKQKLLESALSIVQ